MHTSGMVKDRLRYPGVCFQPAHEAGPLLIIAPSTCTSQFGFSLVVALSTSPPVTNSVSCPAPDNTWPQQPGLRLGAPCT